MLRIQEEGENPRRRLILAPSERANHGNLLSSLTPQGGRIQEETGGLVEGGFGELSRPQENASGNYS